jgi:hypothetical protein
MIAIPKIEIKRECFTIGSFEYGSNTPAYNIAPLAPVARPKNQRESAPSALSVEDPASEAGRAPEFLFAQTIRYLDH